MKEKTMIERMEEILSLIERFNEDFSQHRSSYNPNEQYCVFSGTVQGYDGNGYPSDSPEDDEISVTF